jgi:hypothetical protein
MEIGSTCAECHHPAPAHSNDGPCVMCWVKVKIAHLEQRISDAVDIEQMERLDRGDHTDD